VYKNRRGFTLIEFLVAIVITMVGLLGLLQSVNLALQHNLNTQLRNEAVTVADDFLNREISKTFDLISTATSSPQAPLGLFTANRKVAAGFKIYSVQRTGLSFSNSKQVNINVIWRHKGTRYQHETTAIISKNQ
jgi:type IV pilus assembly protein PilV